MTNVKGNQNENPVNFEDIRAYLLVRGFNITDELNSDFGEHKQAVTIDQEVDGWGLLDATVIIDSKEESFWIDELYQLEEATNGTYVRSLEIEDPDGKIKNQFVTKLIEKALECRGKYTLDELKKVSQSSKKMLQNTEMYKELMQPTKSVQDELDKLPELVTYVDIKSIF